MLPLRDCTSQELNLLCHLDGFVIQTFSYFILDSLLSFNFLCRYIIGVKLFRLLLNGGSSWQGSLKTLQPFDSPPSGINGLISSFVNVLQVKKFCCFLNKICFLWCACVWEFMLDRVHFCIVPRMLLELLKQITSAFFSTLKLLSFLHEYHTLFKKRTFFHFSLNISAHDFLEYELASH